MKGEKSTQYFCNLEKKHYLEKIIPKLILESKQEISDPRQIRNEQKDFIINCILVQTPVSMHLTEICFLMIIILLQ